MSLEIEKKYPLTEELWTSIRQRLLECGAQALGHELEENTIFRGGPLDLSNGIIRIRRTNDRSTLTFKRRMEGSASVKTQVEYESEVTKPDEVVAILQQLGLEKRVVYEKRRETWALGDTEVVLDELPFGLYMEIEGSVEAIKEAEKLLEIEELSTETKTYPFLTTELGVEKNGIYEARFKVETI